MTKIKTANLFYHLISFAHDNKDFQGKVTYNPLTRMVSSENNERDMALRNLIINFVESYEAIIAK